jgi:hypothetical protein
MITAHFGVAAVVRRRWPGASLFPLLAASVAPDAVDLAFKAVGVCNPNGLYSHTLPAAALLAAVLGAASYAATRSRTTALASAALVFAHLPLDLVTGYKLYWPGGRLLGLRLYRYPALDFLVEVPLIVGGWWLLRREGSAPRWATSVASIVALVALQAAVDAAWVSKPNACAGDPRVSPWPANRGSRMLQ